MIISIIQAQIFFLAFTRVMAVIIHIPMLGGNAIPNQVRIALGFILTMVLIPWQPLPPETMELGLFAFLVAILREIIIGTLAGFAANLTFGTIQIAGEAMGLGSGFGSSRIFNPSMETSVSAYDQMFIMVATLIFLVVNGHHFAIIALQRTFEAIPVNSAIEIGSVNTLITMFSQLVAAGIQMAMPVMAALLLTDITLGLLARVAPQIQVFFLGLPLKVAVSLVALGLLFSVIFPSLSNLFQQMGPRMVALIQR
jgi:flagellar biosynthetic protein FliR